GTTPCSPLATLYTDATLATPCTGTLKDGSVAGATNCSNPLITDAQGNYHFYAQGGTYTLQVYGSGLTTTVEPDISIAGSLATGRSGVCQADQQAGSDIVQQILACMNTVIPNGGQINIAPKTGGGCYVATTQLLIPNNGASPPLQKAYKIV